MNARISLVALQDVSRFATLCNHELLLSLECMFTRRCRRVRITRVAAFRWGAVRRFYVFTALDHAVPRRLQRILANRLGVEATFQLAQGDHSAMLSAPQEVASVLLKVADRTA